MTAFTLVEMKFTVSTVWVALTAAILKYDYYRHDHAHAGFHRLSSFARGLLYLLRSLLCTAGKAVYCTLSSLFDCLSFIVLCMHVLLLCISVTFISHCLLLFVSQTVQMHSSPRLAPLPPVSWWCAICPRCETLCTASYLLDSYMHAPSWSDTYASHIHSYLWIPSLLQSLLFHSCLRLCLHMFGLPSMIGALHYGIIRPTRL